MNRAIYATIILGIMLTACTTAAPPTQQEPTAFPANPSARPWHVCIDPGHGGPWSGAIAPTNGLRESDINLAISLRLRNLLEADGIQVTMTRTTDTALVTDNLSKDLLARAKLANESGADLFISVHHNADIVNPSTKDDIEIYYARRDPAASKDLATHILHNLAKTFPEPENKLLLPGNYSVIRNTTMPAVLTETAYLTDPKTAARYAEPETLEAEANSLYNAVRTYLDTTPPLRTDIKFIRRPDHHIELTLAQKTDERIADIKIENQSVPFQIYDRDGSRALIKQHLTNNPHIVTVRLQNSSGQSSDHHLEYEHIRAAAQLIAELADPLTPLRPGAHAAIRIRLSDFLGYGVPRQEIRVSETQTVTTNADGIAFAYVPIQKRAHRVKIETNSLTTRLDIPSGDNTGASTLLIHDESAPVPYAEVTTTNGTTHSTVDGWAATAQGPIKIRAPGYMPYEGAIDSPQTIVTLEKPANSTLLGRTILLDPLDGGRHPGATGPTGLRSSDLAHDVARLLAEQLRSAGATPVTLRNDDEEIGELSRITRGEVASPNLYIGITFGINIERARLMDDEGQRIEVPSSFATHYPGSTNGSRFANLVMKKLDLETVTNSVYYPVQQMSCPAVLIQPTSIVQDEQALREPGYSQRIAQRIFDAITAFYKVAPAP